MARSMALYARVSTQEQTEGNYPSCESQIEELERFCKSQGWEVIEAIKDEEVSAGSLKRKGLTHMRWLMESGQSDGCSAPGMTAWCAHGTFTSWTVSPTNIVLSSSPYTDRYTWR